MPFAGYEDHDACVADNQDKDDPDAFCADLKDRVEALHAEHPSEGREHAHMVRIHRGLALADTVRRTENDDGSVTYSNLAILAAGEWTDSATEQTVYYSPEALQKIADDPGTHVVDTDVNVNHEHADQLKQVGHFDPESISYREETLFADITLHGRTQASEDTIGLMDLALETDGQQGAGGPSVEIPFEGEVSEFDKERGMERLTEFNLSGLAIVTSSASEDVAFAEQFADRAIAMADGDGELGSVRVMQAGQTALNHSRQAAGMGEETEDADEHTLETSDGAQITIKGGSMEDIEEAIGQVDGAEVIPTEEPEEEEEDEGQQLQGEDALQEVAGLIGEFLQENDPEAPASEFVAFVENETETELEAIQPVLEAYIAEVDADSLEETPVSALQGFVDAQLDEGGGEPEGEEPEEEMAEKLETVEEENRQLRAEIDDLASRLESIEDESAGTATARETASPDDEEETREPAPAAGGVQKRGEWIGR